MEKFKILPLNTTDIQEISLWDKKFQNDPRYASIEYYILEHTKYDNIYYNLAELIRTNYEVYPIGDNERKFAFSIKNDKEIIGFVLAIVDDLKTSNPELIIQYIVLNPDYQNMGIGTKVLKNLINNSEEYFNSNISRVYARIENTNTASLNTFKKLGFNIHQVSEHYSAAQCKILENIKE